MATYVRSCAEIDVQTERSSSGNTCDKTEESDLLFDHVKAAFPCDYATTKRLMKTIGKKASSSVLRMVRGVDAPKTKGVRLSVDGKEPNQEKVQDPEKALSVSGRNNPRLLKHWLNKSRDPFICGEQNATS